MGQSYMHLYKYDKKYKCLSLCIHSSSQESRQSRIHLSNCVFITENMIEKVINCSSVSAVAVWTDVLCMLVQQKTCMQPATKLG